MRNPQLICLLPCVPRASITVISLISLRIFSQRYKPACRGSGGGIVKMRALKSLFRNITGNKVTLFRQIGVFAGTRDVAGESTNYGKEKHPE